MKPTIATWLGLKIVTLENPASRKGRLRRDRQKKRSTMIAREDRSERSLAKLG
jgi:hypothetical protein